MSFQEAYNSESQEEYIFIKRFGLIGGLLSASDLIPHFPSDDGANKTQIKRDGFIIFEINVRRRKTIVTRS